MKCRLNRIKRNQFSSGDSFSNFLLNRLAYVSLYDFAKSRIKNKYLQQIFLVFVQDFYHVRDDKFTVPF